jgi:hypothetical protein
MPCERAYWPVSRLARLGEHSGVVAKAFRKRTPSRARRSMFGVSMNGCPAAAKSSQRMSSTTTNTTLGGGDAVSGARLAESAQAMTLAAAIRTANRPRTGDQETRGFGTATAYRTARRRSRTCARLLLGTTLTCRVHLQGAQEAAIFLWTMQRKPA